MPANVFGIDGLHSGKSRARQAHRDRFVFRRGGRWSRRRAAFRPQQQAQSEDHAAENNSFDHSLRRSGLHRSGFSPSMKRRIGAGTCLQPALPALETEGIVTDKEEFRCRECTNTLHGRSVATRDIQTSTGLYLRLLPSLLAFLRGFHRITSRDRGINFSSFNQRGNPAHLLPA